jgi:hypothetical protein
MTDAGVVKAPAVQAVLSRVALWATVLAAVWVPRAAAAQQTDVIRGRVTGPDSLPVPSVEVRATSYQGGVVKVATTDKNGRYTLVFLNGEGDYWLDFRKLGLAQRRFELKRIGDEEVLIADTRMTSTIATLDAVSINAPAPRALPNRNAHPDVGGGDRPLTNSSVLLATDQAGNLAAMAATVAGIQFIPGFDGASDMFSVLGLGGDQNNTTFNGLGSGISALPPDFLATTSIHPYPFDPAYGGFSGAQVSIQTLPGTNFSRRAMTNADIAPSLEWADATADALAQRFTTMRLGGNAAGPISPDQAFYNVAYNYQRRFSEARSLVNTSPAGLAAAGVASDSVARFLGILRQEGVPLSATAVPALATLDQVQAAANVDLMPSASGAGHSFVLGTAANYQRSQPVTLGGLLYATPSHGGETSFWGANVALVHSNYFWFGILEKTTLGFASSSQSIQPYANLPEGSVIVGSALPDGSSSVRPLLFGGNSATVRAANRALQLNNQLSWYSDNNAHTIKITSTIAQDGFNDRETLNRLGTYSFNSLSDLAAGRPSSFTRTLDPTTPRGSQLVGMASIGDYWRPSQNVQLQYGLRLDANHFFTQPSLNPMVINALGIRNDAVPNQVYLSPRVGLQWYYGSSPQIAYAPGAARPPRAAIHLGAGVFQNVATSQLISSALLATGLPSSSQAVTCVGSAVPAPDWNSFVRDSSSIPTRCADGSTGSVFSSSAPNVTLFAPRFAQPRSLRAAADWSGPVLDNRFVLGVQAISSSGLDQAGAVDINLNATRRFSLANEAGRPIFVDPSAIVPSTGTMGVASSRVSNAFQFVTLERSDLAVRANALNVNVKPITANPLLRWSLTYSLLAAREKVNGFTSTAGNPFDTYWSDRQQNGKNTVTVEWNNLPIFDLLYVSAGLQFVSGQRYTPVVAGDVNGDGYANDRAFIFAPNATTDSATAAGMRALLAHGTPAARECLERQLGRLAERGSCQAPWAANAGLRIQFNPQKIGLPKRLAVTLDVRNPLGIADLALHGANAVHGWGQLIPPDQNLLFVRGFDPTTRQFRYDVNQRFGSTRPQQSSTHVLPYASLTFGLDIGVPRERQLLTQRLDMGRGQPGSRQSAASLKLFGTTTIPNPMNMILQQQESLNLTRPQADSLAMLSYEFSLFADSVWTPVSKSLAELGESYDGGAAYARYVRARERTVDYLLALVPEVKGVLSASQRRRLPPQISNYLDERVLRFLRSSTAGDNGSVVLR